MNRFIVLGSLNYDLTFGVRRLPDQHEKCRADWFHEGPGGAAANTAWWLGKAGKSVRMWGCVGTDPWGEAALASLQSVGVDVSDIQCSAAHRTGRVAIFAEGDHKRMISWRGANAATNLDLFPRYHMGRGVHVHIVAPFSPELLRLVKCAVQREATLSFDLNGREMNPCTELASFVFANRDELERVASCPAEDYALNHARQGMCIVVTDGARGAFAVRDSTIKRVPAEPCEVADRTGGGDAFVAGFLAAQSEQETLVDCLANGLSLASVCIRGQGARPT